MNFYETPEAELVTGSTNFSDLINADAPQYGLQSKDAEDYAVLNQAYAVGYARSRNPSTDSREATALKNQARDALVREARRLTKLCQAARNMDDAKRRALGINVPDRDPSRKPRPTTRPGLGVGEVDGHRIGLVVRDADNPRRSRPIGAAGANVLIHVGESAPATIAEWAFQGNATRRRYEFTVPASAQPGAKVWITAAWYGTRGETGPMATPIVAHVGFGGVTKAA